MGKRTIEMTPDELAEVLRDLPPTSSRWSSRRWQIGLRSKSGWRLQESAFREWLSEPDLYADDRPAR